MIKDFLKGTLRIALAIFLALGGLAAAVAAYSHVQESREREAAKPLEEVRDWQVDLKDRIGASILAKTKLVSGRLLVAIYVDGYPKYFADRRNQNGSLNFEFIDKDGFKIATRAVELSQFTTTVGKSGEATGLQHQYEQLFDVELYRKFSGMQVGWNLITEPVAGTEIQVAKPTLDPCAPPNLKN